MQPYFAHKIYEYTGEPYFEKKYDNNGNEFWKESKNEMGDVDEESNRLSKLTLDNQTRLWRRRNRRN